MSVQVSYKKQFLLGIMFLLVIIMIVEGIARTFETHFPNCVFLDEEAFKDTDYYLVRQICLDNLALLTIQPEIFEPPIIFLKPNQHSQTINMNSHGFRGPEISQEKPENTYRIFVLGGSTGFGSGSTSDETSIPGFLQKKFNEINLDKRVEVINAGISSFESFAETYYVKTKLIHFDPDLLIVYDGANDAWVNGFEVDSDGNIIEPKKIDDAPEEEERIFKFGNYPFYRTPFVFKTIIRNIDVTPTNFTDSLISPELVSLWKNRWNEVCELGKTEGFDTMITIQPMIGIGKKPYSPAELVKYGDGLRYQPLAQNFQGMVDSLKELDKTCTKTADLRDTFENITQTVYFDSAHVTDFGNEIIAQRLFELSLPIIENNS